MALFSSRGRQAAERRLLFMRCFRRLPPRQKYTDNRRSGGVRTGWGRTNAGESQKLTFTFADGLRAIVRQDPDVILIGKSAMANCIHRCAISSYRTSCFSTLHTNDAPGAVTRLFDMDVEPFLLSSVLRGVLAQRLVRILCPHCARPAELTPKYGTSFALPACRLIYACERLLAANIALIPVTRAEWPFMS